MLTLQRRVNEVTVLEIDEAGLLDLLQQVRKSQKPVEISVIKRARQRLSIDAPHAVKLRRAELPPR